MKKALAILLTLVLCLPCFVGLEAINANAVSEKVYTVVTNPGEDSKTQINIGWFADYSCTNCSVQYTLASDTSFASAKTAKGSYNAKDYLWFYNRYTTSSTSSARFTKQFLNYDCTITGLTPNTEYIYRVADGNGAYSKTMKFKTAGQDRFSMIWSSDVHITHNETSKINRWNKALAHAETMNAYPISLHLNTGDMTACGDRFYFWKALYDTPIISKYTYASVLGNHDTYDNMMDDDANYTKLWNTGKYFGVANAYPKNGYTQTSARLKSYLGTEYASYVSSSADEIFTVNTGSLAGKTISGATENLDGRSYWFIYNDILFIMFDYYAYSYSAVERTEAFKWANSVIAANEGKYKYLFAAEHINLFNGGDGEERTYSSTTYYDVYKDWLDKNNVDVFLCGDNHIYFRTGKMYANSKTTDNTKGTYICQAPAITNTTTYPTYVGAIGYGECRYSSATYLGVCVFDIDENGITLKCDVSTNEGSSFSRVETVKLDKVARQVTSSTSTVTGLYTTKANLTVYETHSTSAKALTTIPANTVIQVNDAMNAWGRVRYNGYTGWVNLNNYNVGYATSSVTAPEAYTVTGYNTKWTDAHSINVYTPTFGATVSCGWSFQYHSTITAVRDSTGAYKVTAQNTDSKVAKSDTAIPANGCVIVVKDTGTSLLSKLPVGAYFTIDENKFLIYSANPGEANTKYYIPGTEPQIPTDITVSTSATDIEKSSLDANSFRGFAKETTVAQAIAKFSTAASYLQVRNSAGTAVDSNAKICTGYTVNIVVDATVKVSYSLVVEGDVNGDGSITSSDTLAQVSHLQAQATLEGAFLTAADFDVNGSVTSSDYLMLVKAFSTGQ